MGEGKTRAENSDFCGTRSGRRWIFKLPRGFDARGCWRAGRPPDLFGWGRAKPKREIPTSAGRGQGGDGSSNFRKGLMPGGAGGPGALQTSPPARKPKPVASFSACGPSGLTCRAMPGNSSIAGAAPLDSVRLRRNRSLLPSSDLEQEHALPNRFRHAFTLIPKLGQQNFLNFFYFTLDI